MIARPRYARLVVGLLLVAPLLSACTQDDLAFVTELAKDWATEHGLLDADGNLDYIGVGLTLANPTRDPEAAAALQAGLVVKNLEDADRLADQGAAEGDLSKIENAIRARPGDWSYQEQKAALLIAQGDLNGATAAYEKSEGLVQERVRQGGDCNNLSRNLLTHRLDALLVQQNRTQRAELQPRIVQTHSELARLANGESLSLCG